MVLYMCVHDIGHYCRLPELEAQSDNGLNDGDSWSTGSNESKPVSGARLKVQ